MLKSGWFLAAALMVTLPAFGQTQGGPPPSPTSPYSASPDQAGPVHLSPPLVARMQRELQADGLYTGPIDGKFGPQTRAALRRFQDANQLRATGAPDTATMLALGGQGQPAQGQGAQANAAGGAQPEGGQSGPGQPPPTPAQARAQALRAYQARAGAATRAGAGTAPGWAASAAPGQGAVSGLAAGSLTQANGSLTSVEGAMQGAGQRTGPAAPRGYFGYSANMSNGFNAATGREP